MERETDLTHRSREAGVLRRKDKLFADVQTQGIETGEPVTGHIFYYPTGSDERKRGGILNSTNPEPQNPPDESGYL
ncbi:hypothetical protein GCM10007416_07090 [Kroppenstedtia guangzhouensis]|uniref:Uncharacterized protein n=1 Tax=Kroppenstedtia guangzhouensis TaxID=1274356 RepID=A0ABQ1G3D8_9BACL|nr:hypothetical protein [Kroppenstedtia guangzhouensis]GGA36741.1 hypothetical protein GCM10007416_07090 [Kroppenstedtia guangzhouensis]